MDDLGTLEQDGDRWTVRFTRHLPHPQEKVWRAVTDPEERTAWFPGTMEGELVAGAPLKFTVETGDVFEGEVIAFDPPRLFELMWGGDRLRIELTPTGGGTTLTLVDTLEELGKAARDGAGWHECLARLAARLDGGNLEWGSVWRDAHPRYVEAFGPAASTIGPPEGI